MRCRRCRTASVIKSDSLFIENSTCKKGGHAVVSVKNEPDSIAACQQHRFHVAVIGTVDLALLRLSQRQNTLQLSRGNIRSVVCVCDTLRVGSAGQCRLPNIESKTYRGREDGF